MAICSERKTTAFSFTAFVIGGLKLIGKTFSRLKVIDKAENYVSPSGAKMKRWLCKCECGNTTICATTHLKSGHTKSCGCYARETSMQNGLKKKHGLKNTRLYRIWQQMKTRCCNPKYEYFSSYGGRGIKVCDEWLDKDGFVRFYEWSMSHGYADDLTIDRIDVNGNYCPENCRWATMKEQSKNKRNTPFVTYKGTVKTLAEWAEVTGIKYQTLFCRYKSGKTPEEILKI